MVTWIELRTAALVGTERRPLPPVGPFGVSSGEALAPDLRALEAAALLGAQRRAGANAALVDPATAAASPGSTDPSERFAPGEASQLLELVLLGTLGKPTTVRSLVEHWLGECVRVGAVAPHHLLVQLLDYATGLPEVRPQVSQVLGSRGDFLASRRKIWEWVVEFRSAGEQEGADAEPIDVAAFCELRPAPRSRLLARLRRHDPEAGRVLVADALPQLDAASRALLLGQLRVGLGPDDEPVLEAALDDRSKAVRSLAISLLDGLVTSARADRLASELTPLVRKAGLLRPTTTVGYPPPPTGEQLRDLPPGDSNLAVEAEWLRALIAGSPLAWWEETLGQTPEAIVARRVEPADDVVAGWTRAALAEGNRAWAGALLARQATPELLGLVGDEASSQLVAQLLKRGGSDAEAGGILAALPQPWTPELSAAIVGWAQGHKTPERIVALHGHLLAAALYVGTRSSIEDWLNHANKDSDVQLHRGLREVLQHLSTRHSISEAFA